MLGYSRSLDQEKRKTFRPKLAEPRAVPARSGPHGSRTFWLLVNDQPWSLDILPAETEANLEGWQMVAGGRSGQGGNDHRKACFGFAHPGGVLDRTLTCNRSGTPAGVQDLFYAVTRRSPLPENPRRPPATLCQPFGLIAQ